MFLGSVPAEQRCGSNRDVECLMLSLHLSDALAGSAALVSFWLFQEYRSVLDASLSLRDGQFPDAGKWLLHFKLFVTPTVGQAQPFGTSKEKIQYHFTVDVKSCLFPIIEPDCYSKGCLALGSSL